MKGEIMERYTKNPPTFSAIQNREDNQDDVLQTLNGNFFFYRLLDDGSIVIDHWNDKKNIGWPKDYWLVFDEELLIMRDEVFKERYSPLMNMRRIMREFRSS